MLNFWRLDTIDGDFFLVSAPTLDIAPTVRAYHLELINRTRSLPHHHLVETDEILFENFGLYYQKIGDRLHPSFDASLLTPHCRHSFFIAAQARGDYWISDLELLMGYEYEEAGGRRQEAGDRRQEAGDRRQEIGGVRITSGDFEIDVLAELLLLPNTNQIEWLIKTRSPTQLMALTKQVSDRLRGKEALDELQREKDLQAFESSKGVEKLKNMGFSL